MFLTPYSYMWFIRAALTGVVIMMIITPFIITSGAGFLSREMVHSIFFTMEFFGAIFLYNEINRLKIIIKEEKINDNIMASISSEVQKKLAFKSSSIGMKGIILAGGTATRLFPLTATTSKQLLPIYDKQMIFYPMNTLIKAGIRDILVIVTPENSGQYLNLLGSIFKNHGVKLYFEVQRVPGGLPEAFIFGENFIGNDAVTLILGDNIFEDDMTEAISNFKSGGHIFAKKVPDPERFGVVKFDENNRVTEIVEKPKNWISDYAIPGLYIFDNEVVEVSRNLKPSDRGELEITDLHRHYLAKNKLSVTTLDGEWLDAGTFDALLDAGNIVREKKITEKFHPIVNEAIEEFNRELKLRMKKILEVHNLYLREEFMLHKKV
jgi:glucose-1-phosphate thymidylyltransferase